MGDIFIGYWGWWCEYGYVGVLLIFGVVGLVMKLGVVWLERFWVVCVRFWG